MDKKNFSSNLKLGKFRSFVKNLTCNQKDLIKSCGFGSLLHFDCSEAPRSVSFWLAKRFDVNTRTVNLQNGSSFTLDPYTVHQILGIPLGGRKIPSKATKAVKDLIGNDTGTGSIAPTVEQLFNLVNNDLEGDKFVRVFMLISLAIFLCPTSHGSASAHYYSGIALVEEIPKYDWCSFVLDWLVISIRRFQESAAKGIIIGKDRVSTLGGCLFVLAVTYFEYLKTADILLRDDIPRLKIWDDYMIRDFLMLDGNSGDGRDFGMVELKDRSETPFLVSSFSSASFSRLPAKVEDFIMRLVPKNEHQNVAAMCRSFYSDMMGSCLAAMQPVIIRQLCRMATISWDGVCRSKSVGTGPNETVEGFVSGAHGRTSGRENMVPETPSSFPSQNPSRRRSLRIIENAARASAARETRQHLSEGVSPNFTNRDDVSNENGTSPMTINCAQVFSHRYDESTSKQGKHGLNESTAPHGVTIEDEGNALFNSSPLNHDQDCEDISGTAATISSTKTRASMHQHAHDSSVQEPVTQMFIWDESDSAKTAPKKKRRVDESTSKQSNDPFNESIVAHGVTIEDIGKTLFNSTPHYNDQECGHVSEKQSTEMIVWDESVCAHSSQNKKRIAAEISNPSKMDFGAQVEPDDLIVLSSENDILIASTDKIMFRTSLAVPIERTSTSGGSDSNSRSSTDKGHDAPVIVSDKFTRRHAIRLPKALCSSSVEVDIPHQKVAVSKFEKDLYYISTRPIGDKVRSKIVARIGRFHVDDRLFGDSQRPRKRVGTFTMNLFCEALNADQKHFPNLKPSKCFITSDAVELLKSKVDVSELVKKLSPEITRFSIKDFNMAMIPVCHNGHWWLTVANLRDHRFDVLNSLEMDIGSSKITDRICSNFRDAYHIMCPESDITDEDAFPIQVQPAPKQRTNYDCGIYVMKYHQLWDGRKIHDISQGDIAMHRQKITAYILSHRSNLETTYDVKKFIERHK